MVQTRGGTGTCAKKTSGGGTHTSTSRPKPVRGGSKTTPQTRSGGSFGRTVSDINAINVARRIEDINGKRPVGSNHVNLINNHTKLVGPNSWEHYGYGNTTQRESRNKISIAYEMMTNGMTNEQILNSGKLSYGSFMGSNSAKRSVSSAKQSAYTVGSKATTQAKQAATSSANAARQAATSSANATRQAATSSATAAKKAATSAATVGIKAKERTTGWTKCEIAQIAKSVQNGTFRKSYECHM